MKIRNTSSIKYSIRLKRSIASFSNRKPIYGIVSITDNNGRPFAFYTPEDSIAGSTALRSHVVVPTLTLMYKEHVYNNGSKRKYMIPIYNLPYNLIKLIYHYIDDYNNDETIKKFFDTRLYNPNIVCIASDSANDNFCLEDTHTNPQDIDWYFTRNVFDVLNNAAITVADELLDAISNNESDRSNDYLIRLLNKYAVFFIYDNADDFNIFVSFLAYSNLSCSSNGARWHQHVLFIRWRPSFDTSNSNIAHPLSAPANSNATYNPFTTHYTTDHIPISLFQNYLTSPLTPLVYHISNADKVLLWMYVTTHGIGYFSDVHSGSNSRTGNDFSYITRHMYVVNNIGNLISTFDFYNFQGLLGNKQVDVSKYIYYLDYHHKNWSGSTTVLDKNIIGVGFIVRSSNNSANDSVSFIDYTEGRFFISNTDGIFHKNHWLTAMLHFLILRQLGFKPVATFRFDYKTKDIDTYMPISFASRLQSIYDESTNIDVIRKIIREKEYKGIIFRMVYDNNNSNYTFYYGLDKDNLEVINVKTEFMTLKKFEDLLKDYIEEINLVRAQADFYNVFYNFLKEETTLSGRPSGTNKYIDYYFKFIDTEPYHSEPAIITNNIDNGIYRHYYKYLSNYYPDYGYYTMNSANVEVFLHEPDNPGIDQIINHIFDSNHPALILYNSRDLEWPITKRNQKSKTRYRMQQSGGIQNEIINRNIRYLRLYDYVNYNNNNIINEMLRTQERLIYPMELSNINYFMPVVLDLAFMFNNSAISFIGGYLIASGEILEYPMLPSNHAPINDDPFIAEIDVEKKLYYREVLYHKYIRYLILYVLYVSYYYPDLEIDIRDITSLNIYRRQVQDAPSQPPRTEINIEMSIALYDNRIIEGNNVELIFVI